MAYGSGATGPDEALSALNFIDPRDLEDQAEWLKVTMAAKSAGIAMEDWDAWCRRDRGDTTRPRTGVGGKASTPASRAA